MWKKRLTLVMLMVFLVTGCSGSPIHGPSPSSGNNNWETLTIEWLRSGQQLDGGFHFAMTRPISAYPGMHLSVATALFWKLAVSVGYTDDQDEAVEFLKFQLRSQDDLFVRGHIARALMLLGVRVACEGTQVRLEKSDVLDALDAIDLIKCGATLQGNVDPYEVVRDKLNDREFIRSQIDQWKLSQVVRMYEGIQAPITIERDQLNVKIISTPLRNSDSGLLIPQVNSILTVAPELITEMPVDSYLSKLNERKLADGSFSLLGLPTGDPESTYEVLKLWDLVGKTYPDRQEIISYLRQNRLPGGLYMWSDEAVSDLHDTYFGVSSLDLLGTSPTRDFSTYVNTVISQRKQRSFEFSELFWLSGLCACTLPDGMRTSPPTNPETAFYSELAKGNRDPQSEISGGILQMIQRYQGQSVSYEAQFYLRQLSALYGTQVGLGTPLTSGSLKELYYRVLLTGEPRSAWESELLKFKNEDGGFRMNANDGRPSAEATWFGLKLIR